MAELYEAWHYKLRAGEVPDKTDERQNAKGLGEYTSRAKAEAAIKRRSAEEGFRDWPDGFRIEVVPVDEGMSHTVDGSLMRSYSVQHFRIGANDEADVDDPIQAATEIGVFSSEQNAKAAIERLRDDPRFCDFPDGFRIDSGLTDMDYWEGGFFSW